MRRAIGSRWRIIHRVTVSEMYSNTYHSRSLVRSFFILETTELPMTNPAAFAPLHSAWHLPVVEYVVPAWTHIFPSDVLWSVADQG